MSFSSCAKDELVKIKLKTGEEKLAALCALTNTAGSLTMGRSDRVGVQFSSESFSVGKYIAQLAGSLYRVDASISVREHKRLNARSALVRLSGGDTLKLLLDIGALIAQNGVLSFGDSVPENLLKSDSARRAFLRGAFLGAGSVSDPSHGYHLEIVCRRESFADTVCSLMCEQGMNAKTMLRKNSFVIYLKDGEMISDFLAFISASGTTLELENVRVEKSLRNYLNRTNNCEMANVQKTIRAAVSQIAGIQLIRKERGLESLPPPLRQVAEARLNNPDASLEMLADLLGIGKSGVNHRLLKLMKIAQEINIERGGV
ncbi:MAG: putative sporulation transcription regulator WhiA [Firmicutes bacterium ADurb.Bin182]|nr:MAG: putative sporulation transcription regulator WhiA [Firmicutes bacterium ADurb.Bin182]